MLGSINPLGERARGSRWAVTVAFFVTGSTLGGAGVGALAGRIGAWLGTGGVLSNTVALPVVAAGLAMGSVLDLGLLRLRLPTVRRQVNEDWLRRYRGWVYGLGFGVQLGLGFVTVVTTSAVYAAFLASLLTASTVLGSVVGGMFGLVRAAPLLLVRRARGSRDMLAIDAGFGRWDGPSRRLAIAFQLALAAVALMMAGI